jgi:NitT/TauT family transport system permease protein
MSLSRAIRLVGTPIALAIVVILVWQIVAGSGSVPGYILPSPMSVADQVRENFATIRSSAWISGSNAAIGLVAGTAIAFLFALLANNWRLFDSVMSPLAAGAAAIPLVALAPLAYAMYSATAEYPRQLIVAIVVFFPVFVNVSKGMKQVLPVHRELLHTYAASRSTFAWRVQIPTSLPFLFNGLRVAAPSAVITSIVTEYFGGGQNGLASYISNAASNTQYAQAWAYVSASVFLGLVFFIVTSVIGSIVNRAMAADV